MIVLTTKYPSQSVADGVNYPLAGKARNVTASGDGTGTPLEKDWMNDLFGWEQALMAAAGLTPNGTPETQISSQLLLAIQTLILQKTIAVYSIDSGVIPGLASAFSLTLQQQYGGFSLSSGLIQVPVAGKYRVRFTGLFSNSSATNPSPVLASIALTGSAVSTAQAVRFDASGSGTSLGLVAEAVLTVATPSANKISVISGAAGIGSTNSGIVTVERLS